jgi:hypothetical protein
MYYTKEQLNTLLKTPYFSDPSTVSTINYFMYRGLYNITVTTIRFNNTFDVLSIVQQVMTTLLTKFLINTKLLGAVGYDLVLSDSTNSSMYLWRSNSNYRAFDSFNENVLFLNYNSLYRFIQEGVNVDMHSLNTNFHNSNVTVYKIVAIVFSFIKI